MKNAIIVSACVMLVVYALSCSKSTNNGSSCSGPKAVTDSSILLAFAKKYNINPVADTSWMYYEIIKAGTGASPVSNSKVYVRYAERLMDGTYIDSTTTAQRFALDSLIKGWQYGIPKIKAGGQIKLLVPSALALGCVGNGSTIPPSSPLYFNIYLDSLK